MLQICLLKNKNQKTAAALGDPVWLGAAGGGGGMTRGKGYMEPPVPWTTFLVKIGPAATTALSLLFQCAVLSVSEQARSAWKHNSLIINQSINQ